MNNANAVLEEQFKKQKMVYFAKTNVSVSQLTLYDKAFQVYLEQSSLFRQNFITMHFGKKCQFNYNGCTASAV